MWFFEGDGTITSVPMTVNLDATPFPVLVDGVNDQPDRKTVLWYGKDSLPDSIWTFSGRNASARRVSISGDYRVAVGSFYRANYGQSHQQVLFYDPANGRSSLWSFHSGDGNHRSDALSKSPGLGYTAFVTRAGMHNGDYLFWYRAGSAPEQAWAIFSPTNIQGGGGCCQINGTYRFVRDAQERSADEEIVMLGEGTTAQTLQLAAEHSPLLGTVTTISGLPRAPRGAVTWFEQPDPDA